MPQNDISKKASQETDLIEFPSPFDELFFGEDFIKSIKEHHGEPVIGGIYYCGGAHLPGIASLNFKFHLLLARNGKIYFVKED